ncbi:MAG: hypothetical protein J7494_10295 [Sphingobium sp.]|nr:hypothetical protein [Sphingobium sp.]
MRHLVLPLLMLASTPALAADQFDLACQGYKWTKLGGSGEAYNFRVRVDLAAKKWCDGECKAAQSIVSVADDKLVLLDEGTLNSRMEVAREATFDRKAGNYHYKFLQSRPADDYLEYQGKCTTEAFTPFPG